MSNECCKNNEQMMILACSGGSNVGQLSNQTAIELTKKGLGKMFCLAGIGGNLKGFVKSAQNADKILAIDGCDVGCAKSILENSGIESDHYLVLTDLDIEKNKKLDLVPRELDNVKVQVRKVLA